MEFKEQEPIEGHVLELRDGSLWEVKGLIHPPGRFIVRPKAIPSVQGGCLSVKGKPYKLVSSPSDRVEILSSKYRDLIKYVDALDSIEILVEEGEVDEVYSPLQALIYLFSNGSYSEFSHAAKSLVEKVSRESTLPLEVFGLGGAYSAGVECPEEPIEIIVYGEEEGFKVYASLKKLRVEGEGFEDLSQRDLLEMYKSWGYAGRIDYNVYLELMSKSNLIGNYLGFRYNFRLVPSKNAIPYSRVKVKRMGRTISLVRIISSEHSIFTPSTYKVEVESVSKGPQVARLVSEIYSLDLRFRELMIEGGEALVEGMVEKVIVELESGDYEESYRINLYSQHHAMIPVRRRRFIS